VTVIFLYDPVRIVPGELLGELMRPVLPPVDGTRPVRQIIAADDLAETVRRAYGVVRGSVFIIATDGTIAYRSPTPQPRQWRRVLDRLLDREPPGRAFSRGPGSVHRSAGSENPGMQTASEVKEKSE